MEERRRVLIVDDDPAVLRTLSRMLGEDCEALTAASASEGLDIARQELLDLAIIDVVMPGMDGRTLASALREGALTRDIPILMLTGLSGPEARFEGFAAGADAYMTKPFDGDSLWASAHRLMAGGSI